MKKMLILLLALCLLLPAAARAQEAPLRVVASFYPMYIATINIARDVPGVEVSLLAPPSAGCLHDYQMSTAERRALEDADAIVLNGAGLEAFMDKLLGQLDAVTIDASEGIDLLEGAHAHDHGDTAHDHSRVYTPGEGDSPNGHIWVSVENMIAQVDNIARGLAQADPAHAAQYAANAAAYVEELQALKGEIADILAPCEGMPIVTFHEAFDYFAGEFGLRVVATVQAIHGGAPSARELADLATLIRQENVRALFAEPQYEDVSVDILSRETGVPVYTIDPAVSGTVDAQDYGAYLRVMLQNAQTIAGALQ